MPPQDVVHQYLLFRGCDIKDLHVHESTGSSQQEQEEDRPPSDPAIVSAEQPKDKSSATGEEGAAASADSGAEAGDAPVSDGSNDKGTDADTSEERYSKSGAETKKETNENAISGNDNKNSEQTENSAGGEDADDNVASQKSNKSNKASNNNNNRRKKNNNNNNAKQMVGSGASLLRRKVRGVVEGDNGENNKLSSLRFILRLLGDGDLFAMTLCSYEEYI